MTLLQDMQKEIEAEGKAEQDMSGFAYYLVQESRFVVLSVFAVCD